MVGVQGSLLSVFVEPIYFSSIILGSLYHGDHLSRAMYQRVSNIEDLPPLYALNKPLLSGKYPPAPGPEWWCPSYAAKMLCGQPGPLYEEEGLSPGSPSPCKATSVTGWKRPLIGALQPGRGTCECSHVHLLKSCVQRPRCVESVESVRAGCPR